MNIISENCHGWTLTGNARGEHKEQIKAILYLVLVFPVDTIGIGDGDSKLNAEAVALQFMLIVASF